MSFRYFVFGLFLTGGALAEELAPPSGFHEVITCQVANVPGVNFYTKEDMATIELRCDDGLHVVVGAPSTTTADQDTPAMAPVHESVDYVFKTTVPLTECELRNKRSGCASSCPSN